MTGVEAAFQRTPSTWKSHLDCVSVLDLDNVFSYGQSYTEEEEGEGLILTMTIPPDCSTVHMLIMGAMPMVVPWK